MPHILTYETSIYHERQEKLTRLVQEYAQEHNIHSGVIFLIADFESDCTVFRQERSFYYITGIEEPAALFFIDIETGKKTLYIPNFKSIREQWVASTVTLGQESYYGVSEIAYSGQPCKGYQCYPFYNQEEFGVVIAELQKYISKSGSIFTLSPQDGSSYLTQRFVLQRMSSVIHGLQEAVVDISPYVAQMRRKKSKRELELMYKAIEVTMDAQEAVARTLIPGKLEYEIQANLEYIFTTAGAMAAFPSIVASGTHSTTLHYTNNNKVIDAGDVVVVDIGAEYNYYCADITRTYPASGKFTDRQKEIYNIVLDTQNYIADIACPGMWLSSSEHQDMSLNHRARQYLKEKGYDKYFPHGIGHFLGLNVHDVGDYERPLEAGDVITIEPGIYIAEENIGVRIEDDYWIVDDGVICMSEELPKDAETIELMMQQKLDEGE